jgi:ATP-dependent RNA helicase DDX3X
MVLEQALRQHPTEVQRDVKLPPVEMQLPKPVASSSGANLGNFEQRVEVFGTGLPGPISSFKEAIPPASPLHNAIQTAGYTSPTPIQRYALPILNSGRDLVATSQTGTGKTAAFLLPTLQSLIEQRAKTPGLQHESGRGDSGGYGSRGFGFAAKPRGVVLLPTRELCQQVAAEAEKLCRDTGIKTALLYGGDSINPQLRALADPRCWLVMATPGRLADITRRGSVNFDSVTHLVLDEADRMLDMGFEPQIQEIIRGFDMPREDRRQTAMFSATFAREVRSLASQFLKPNYAFVEVGREGSTMKTITQQLIFTQPPDKPARLLEILQKSQDSTTLVFTQTKMTADLLLDYLHRADRRLASLAATIHGDKTQPSRDRALADFKSGRNKILIATGVASRGLDIPSVAHVINYDLGQTIEEYVHRIGRTGRAGRLGLATTFITPADRGSIRALVRVLEESGSPIPAWLHQMHF